MAGIGVYPVNGEDADGLMKSADLEWQASATAEAEPIRGMRQSPRRHYAISWSMDRRDMRGFGTDVWRCNNRRRASEGTPIDA